MDDIETNNIIQKIFNENKIQDLKDFIKKRSCLNTSGQYLTYLFYLLQSSGVFLTSIGNAYKRDMLIWSGVGASSLASFIYIVINSNSKINSQLLNNVKQIYEGNYIDEGGIDAMTEKKNNASTPTIASLGKKSTTEI